MSHCDILATIQVPERAWYNQIKMIEIANQLKVYLDIPYEVTTPTGRRYTQLEIAYEKKEYKNNKKESSKKA